MLTTDQQRLDDGCPLPSAKPSRELSLALYQLAVLSQKMFGPSVTIQSMHDPDAPQEPWIVFHVTPSGDFAKRREQADKWYDEAAKILPDSATDVRLSIMPRA